MLTQFISSIRTMFSPAKARDIAERQFQQYQRELLDHQAAATYHTKMAQYCDDSIKRLSQFKQLSMH